MKKIAYEAVKISHLRFWRNVVELSYYLCWISINHQLVFDPLRAVKQDQLLIHFIPSGYLIRFHTKNSQKYLYFHRKLTFIRTRYRQNWDLWRHFGDIMSPENQSVFQLLKEVAFWRILAFCSLWEVCESSQACHLLLNLLVWLYELLKTWLVA